MSQLFVNGKSVRSFVGSDINNSIRIILRDTDVAGAIELNGVDIQWIKALGICYNFRNWSVVAIVALERKEALLHKYLVRASTTREFYTFDKKHVDVASLSLSECTMNRVALRGSSDELVIDKWGDAIEVDGFEGSVCLSSLGRGDVCSASTIYELLTELSGVLSVNLMSYKRVVITSKHERYHTLIEFVHSIAAERFFTKMSLDVTG